MIRRSARIALLSLLAVMPPLVAQVPPTASPDDAEIVVQGRRMRVAPLVGGTDFISPMGEPFHSPDRLSGAEHWFRQADADHDGRLTKAEMRADADRFFKLLDVDRDGEIGPLEISRYEQVVAPEIVVLSTYGDYTKAKTDSDGKTQDPPYPDRLGAGRYGYLAMPEPVTYADTNLDRGVTLAEFETAADKRFRLLDRNGDGLIPRDELPRLASVHSGG